MHDLRRQALLESRKTVSRKAASREASRSTSRVASAQTSRQNSRQSSRAASRYPSDDEDEGNLSDETETWSTGSLDDLADNPESDNVDWPEELADCMQDILDRKRSSVQGREESLSAFCRLAKFHYVEEEIRGSIQDLLAAFLRSIKYEGSVRESVLALKALEFLAVTAYDDTIYDAVESLLTKTIRDSTSGLIKVAAINCLGTCAYFGGTSEDAKMDQMNMLLDIITSDGQSIEASADYGVVTAALQQWGFLATDVEDLEADSEEVVEILIEQLASVDSNVQIAAGENIALLYEKSYTPQEEEDEIDEDELDEEGEGGDSSASGGPKLIERYPAYHDKYHLEQILASLATGRFGCVAGYDEGFTEDRSGRIQEGGENEEFDKKDSQDITTQVMVGFLLAFVVTLPLMLIHTSKIRHLFSLKAVVFPIAALGVVCWAMSANGGVSAGALQATTSKPSSTAVFA
uniref:Uracil permease n=1 Tax=Talaromyces marneffei PM1 TaxID=1077442 RepID=A0A093VB44_TALMA